MMEDYLYDVKLSDTNKRKKALKELNDLSEISEESRGKMRLAKYHMIRTRERKIRRYLHIEHRGAIYE